MFRPGKAAGALLQKLSDLALGIFCQGGEVHVGNIEAFQLIMERFGLAKLFQGQSKGALPGPQGLPALGTKRLLLFCGDQGINADSRTSSSSKPPPRRARPAEGMSTASKTAGSRGEGQTIISAPRFKAPFAAYSRAVPAPPRPSSN